MLEIILFMLAAAVHAAQPQAGAPGTAPSETASETQAAPPAPTVADRALPASPEGGAGDNIARAGTQQATASPPPAFLAPPATAASEGGSAPVFLAPKKPALQPEPQVPTGRFTTAVEVKPILRATKSSWITVRPFNGQDLVYVTQIWAWRCGLLELKVGINGNPPEPWPLPPCHMDLATPNAVLETDGLPYRAFPAGSVAMVEVELTYDDLDKDRGKFNRQGMPIP